MDKSLFKPKTFDELPDFNNVSTVQVNEEVNANYTTSAQKKDEYNLRNRLEWIFFNGEKINMQFTINSRKISPGAKSFWEYRALGVDNYVYVVRFDPHLLKSILVEYHF